MNPPGGRPYLPTTDEEKRQAPRSVGLSEDGLHASVPPEMRLSRPLDLPEAIGEIELTRLARRLAGANATTDTLVSFLGAGCYDHFIPAAVDTVALRGEVRR